MIKEYNSQFDTLIGKNIILRKAKEKDYLSMFENVWNNEDVYKWMLFTPTTTLEASKVRVHLSIIFQKDHYCYFVSEKETDEAIGFCGVEEIKDGIFRECGICIGTKYQGRGYGKEVLGLLLDLSFNKLEGNTFIYGSFTDNTRSMAMAKKYGFSYLNKETALRNWDKCEKEINNYILTKQDYLKYNRIKEDVIKTDRLVLKSLTDIDMNDFLELLDDSLIKETYMIPDFKSLDDKKSYFIRIKDLTNSKNHYSYGIFLDGKVIGFINDVTINDLTIEVGYFISSNNWNHGYATEALKGLIGMLFRVGFKRVEAAFFEGNERSKRVMEKSGMKRISKEEIVEYRGKVHNCIFYIIEK